MKKIFLLLLSTIIFCSSNNITAQSLSIEDTKELLYKHQWMLRRYEKDGSMFTVPKEKQGMRLVFMRNGQMYYYLPSNLNIPTDYRTCTITTDKIFYGSNVEDPRYAYVLKSFVGMKLYMKNDDDGDDTYTEVWEEAEVITGNNYPKTNSILVGANRNSYQSTPAKARVFIQAIDAKLKEAIGNIRMKAGSKEKYIVEDASFTDTEIGVKIMAKIGGAGKVSTVYTFEFMPEEIEEISQRVMASVSPVGMLQLNFYSKSVHIIDVEKKTISSDKYEDFAVINFLKIDPKNYKLIESDLNKLSEIYINDRAERLDRLVDFMNTKDKFWVSANGSSKTYLLQEVFATGSIIRFEYSLKAISTRGDVEGNFFTEIPLSDIEDITLDKSKSRPNTIILHSGKKGFRTYILKEDEGYQPDMPVKEIPLFIDVAESKRLSRVVELLRTHVKECGGGKLKL